MKTTLEVKKQILMCQGCDLGGKCRSPIPFTAPTKTIGGPSTTPGKLSASAAETRSEPPHHHDALLPAFTVLGEAPGRIEDYQGKPFVGPAGQLLRRGLRNVGLDSDNGFYMNVVSCWPHGKPNDAQIAACRVNLKDQLDISPRFVLCCGGTALKALIPHATLKAAAGKIIPIHGKLVMPILHPAFFLHKSVAKDMKETWDGMLAKFAVMLMWHEDDDDLPLETCIYCDGSGHIVCKKHQGFWSVDQQWDRRGRRRTKKTGLQDERLFSE